MFKIIVFTHGDLAESLKKTAELISGKNELLEFFVLPYGCNTELVLQDVVESIKRSVEQGFEVLVFTDLFFGTPFNLLMTVVEEHDFSHITGLNLPMLLEAISYQGQNDMSLKEIVIDLVSKGRESIIDCDELVTKFSKLKG